MRKLLGDASLEWDVYIEYMLSSSASNFLEFQFLPDNGKVRVQGKYFFSSLGRKGL